MGETLSRLDLPLKSDLKPQEFSMVKSFSDKNIGCIEMFKHGSRSEYMIRK